MPADLLDLLLNCGQKEGCAGLAVFLVQGEYWSPKRIALDEEVLVLPKQLSNSTHSQTASKARLRGRTRFAPDLSIFRLTVLCLDYIRSPRPEDFPHNKGGYVANLYGALSHLHLDQNISKQVSVSRPAFLVICTAPLPSLDLMKCIGQNKGCLRR